MDNFLRAHEDLGMRDPTPLQRKTFGVLEKWMRATGAITGWNDCATYTELGDAIVELLRYQHVDRYSGGQADTVSRALYSSTHPNDKWGIMEKKIVKAKPVQPSSGKAVAAKKVVR
eukprot:PhM_4_TR10096/c2_g2_i3/m.19627